MGIVSSNGLNSILDIKDYDETTEKILQSQTSPSGQNTFNNPIFSTTSEAEQVDIDDKIFNVEIKNLPHRTYNGVTGNLDKTIYQMGSLLEGKTIGGDRIIEHYPREKIRVPLHNGGEMILNQLEVQISDEFGKQETDLRQTTNLTLEITQ